MVARRTTGAARGRTRQAVYTAGMSGDSPTSAASAGERRDTLRLDLSLPFQWLAYADQPALDRVNADLAADPQLERRWEAAALATELERALRGLTDAATSAALRILGRQVELLTDAALARPDPPPEVGLNLSAEGIGFLSPSILVPGTWLGVHLILPGDYPLIGSARVSRCVESANGQQVGARLVELSPGAERRLNRYLLAQSAPRPR